MYYFKYKIVDSDQELVIATTRPETMFADHMQSTQLMVKNYQLWLIVILIWILGQLL